MKKNRYILDLTSLLLLNYHSIIIISIIISIILHFTCMITVKLLDNNEWFNFFKKNKSTSQS